MAAVLVDMVVLMGPSNTRLNWEGLSTRESSARQGIHRGSEGHTVLFLVAKCSPVGDRTRGLHVPIDHASHRGIFTRAPTPAGTPTDANRLGLGCTPERVLGRFLWLYNTPPVLWGRPRQRGDVGVRSPPDRSAPAPCGALVASHLRLRVMGHTLCG